GQVLGSYIHPGQEWKRDDTPGRMNRQQPQDYPNVAVDMRRPRRTWSRVVMDSRSVDERPIALSRRVVDRQGESRLIDDQGPDHLADQLGGDLLGLLAGGRDCRVAGVELIAQSSGTYPTGDGPPPTGQNRAEKQPGQSECRS